MQVATQEQNTVVAQNRGYWGYEEIDSAKQKQIAGAGDCGCGGCGCGCGCASDGGSSGSVPGDGVSSQGTASGGSSYGGGYSDNEGYAEGLANCFASEADAFACVVGGPPGGAGLNSVNDGYDAMGNQTGGGSN